MAASCKIRKEHINNLWEKFSVFSVSNPLGFKGLNGHSCAYGHKEGQ